MDSDIEKKLKEVSNKLKTLESALAEKENKIAEIIGNIENLNVQESDLQRQLSKLESNVNDLSNKIVKENVQVDEQIQDENSRAPCPEKFKKLNDLLDKINNRGKTNENTKEDCHKSFNCKE